MPSARRRITLLAGLAAGALLSAATAAPAGAAIDVTFGEEATPGPSFATLDCLRTKRALTVTAEDGQWRLLISIRPFAGRRAYAREHEIAYGENASPAAISIARGTKGGAFTSLNRPQAADDPIVRLTLGGSVAFRRHGRDVGVAMPFVYDGEGAGAEFARVTGFGRCARGSKL